MEQHQIPRQITTFEFKLIGFMTLTQFVYLIVFLPLSYITLRLVPIPILNILLAFGVAFLGLALAFLPINSRPLDIWIKNLYKRITSPTQFFYHKQAHGLEFIQNLYFDVDPHKVEAHVASQEALSKYLSNKKEDSTHLNAAPSFLPHLEEKKLQIAAILQKPYEFLVRREQKSPDKSSRDAEDMQGKPPGVEEKEKKPFDVASLGNTRDKQDKPADPDAMADRSANMPKEEEFIEVRQEEQKLEEHKKEKAPEEIGTKKSIIEERQDRREEQKEALNEREADEVVAHLKELSKDIQAPEAPPQADKSSFAQEVRGDKPEESEEKDESKPSESEESAPSNAKSMEDKPAVAEAMAAREDNQPVKKPAEKKPFFAGVVKNAKNIPLPGILIYVKGTDSDKPLRLLKSNPYGVFATYNPIPSGIYTFEIRDPKGLFNFDTMKVAVKDENNEILEFYSK